MYYLTDTDDHPEGWGGLDTSVGSDGNALLAIDYRTGKIAWRHEWPSGSGVTNILTHGGQAAVHQQRIEPDRVSMPPNGKILWHAGSDGRTQRRADHLHAGRQAVSAGGRGRQPVCIPRQ